MSGLRPPAVLLSTRNSVALTPWARTPTLPTMTPVIGVDRLTGVPFGFDPFTAYAHGIVSGPNLLVAGQLGRGKSALVKTLLARHASAGRGVFVLDPKGEYAALADAVGLPRLRLAPGGDVRLNPLDPPPGPPDPAIAHRHRAQLLTALAGTGLGRALDPDEHAALDAALTLAAAGRDLVLLRHVTDALLTPTAESARQLSFDQAQLADAGRPVALTLRRLLSGDLAGMLDGPTTIALDPTGPGLVLDLSAVHGTTALAPVLVAASRWLTQALASPSTRNRFLLLDEAWAVLATPATTNWLQGVSKLARAHGLSLITVVHRLSDLTAQADTGTATAAQALGLLADTETRVIYGQPPGERDHTQRLLGLSDVEADLVVRLGPYRALWKIGPHSAVVDHQLTDTDIPLVDTDAAMRANSYEFANAEASFAGTRG